jgi:plastocyanin
MSSDKSITANFIKKKYTLTVNTEGEGTVNQKVIKTGSATDYNSRSVIELTATANSPWSFNQWDGDLTGTDNPKQITIDKNKTVTAIFELLINSYKIYVTSSSSADYNLTGKDRDGDVSGKDPDLTFSVGDQVTFIVDATPFYLKTIAGIGTGNQIDVSNNGTGNGSIIWVPKAAGTYYYQCELHSEMVGTITIQN